MKKKCAKCNRKKNLNDFGIAKARKDGRQPYCKQCRKEYAVANIDKAAKYHRKHRKKVSYKKWYSNYVEKNRDKIRSRSREYDRKIKLQVFDAYGGPICACCGEKEISFLVIDHINGGGTQHRKSLPSVSGKAVYLWLRKNNFPEGYRVLCQNCNWGVYVNGGVCPHKK